MKKRFFISSAVIALIYIVACNKDDFEVIDFGRIELQAISREALPYYGKQRVIFKDSLGNELEFWVLSTFNSYTPVNKRSKSKFETYTQVWDEFRLYEPNSINFNIWARLTPEFSSEGPEGRQVADFLYFMAFDQRSSTPKLDTLFSKMIFQGGWPLKVNENEYFDVITILGREFKNVERRKNPLPSGAEAYYNQDFGMVAFRNYDGRFWRFEAFY